MNVKQMDAANAYSQAAQNFQNLTPSSGGDDVAKSGSAFADLISDQIGEVRQATSTAELTSAKSLTGQADLVDVVTSVSNAEMVVDTVVAVRDRVISAYNDILKMPI
jgi:flagellar hook-basal body complex protein FliE